MGPVKIEDLPHSFKVYQAARPFFPSIKNEIRRNHHLMSKIMMDSKYLIFSGKSVKHPYFKNSSICL